MSKELEMLKNIEKEVEDSEGFDESTHYQMDRTRFQTVEKALKALEIIKNKKVNVYLLSLIQVYDEKEQLKRYNDTAFIPKENFLTQEEFELLRGVLLCQQ